MEFTADNGIRFIDRRKELTLEHFISIGNESTTVFLMNDIIVDFQKGKYISSYNLPFWSLRGMGLLFKEKMESV